MLLAVLPISVLSAAWAGMTGFGARSSRLPQAFYVLLAAAAPMGVMIVISALRSAIRLVAQFRRPR
jgi:hypothetical protein